MVQPQIADVKPLEDTQPKAKAKSGSQRIVNEPLDIVLLVDLAEPVKPVEAVEYVEPVEPVQPIAPVHMQVRYQTQPPTGYKRTKNTRS